MEIRILKKLRKDAWENYMLQYYPRGYVVCDRKNGRYVGRNPIFSQDKEDAIRRLKLYRDSWVVTKLYMMRVRKKRPNKREDMYNKELNKL